MREMGLHGNSVQKVPLFKKGVQILGKKSAQRTRDLPRDAEWKKMRVPMTITISSPVIERKKE